MNIESQNLRGWKGPQGNIKSKAPAKAVPYNRSHMSVSTCALNISIEGDSTTSLCSLFQCSVILTVKKLFLRFIWNFLYSSFRPLLLVLSLRTTYKQLHNTAWALHRAPFSKGPVMGIGDAEADQFTPSWSSALEKFFSYYQTIRSMKLTSSF